jgi:hypothetical protein
MYQGFIKLPLRGPAVVLLALLLTASEPIQDLLGRLASSGAEGALDGRGELIGMVLHQSRSFAFHHDAGQRLSS